MPGEFSEKVVLVAGGTGALGRAVTLAFLNQGAKAIVTYRAKQEFTAFEKEAGSHGSLLDGYATDVVNENAVRELMTQILAKHKRIDVLVNAVGAFAGGTSLWETDSHVLDRMLALNLRSGFTLCHAVVPLMLQQSSGAIVNVASRAAVDHAAGAAAYVASKAAAVALIDSLAADLKGTGVRANSVLPSIIDTEANRKAMPNSDFSKWPKPQEIANVILYLSSDQAKLIHGASIPVYGNR